MIEASRLPPLQSELPPRLRAAVRAFKVLALLSICAPVLTGASRAVKARSQQPRQPMGRRSLLARVLCLPGRRRGKLEDPLLSSHKSSLQSAVIKLIVHSGPGSPSKTDAHHLARPRSASSVHRLSGSGASASSRSAPAQGAACTRLRRLCQRFPWGAALAATALLVALCGSAGAQLALRVSRPFVEQPAAVAVHGQYSRFTLMVMSYDARLATLQWYIQHYSQCPSVGKWGGRETGSKGWTSSCSKLGPFATWAACHQATQQAASLCLAPTLALALFFPSCAPLQARSWWCGTAGRRPTPAPHSSQRCPCGCAWSPSTQ